MAKKNNRAQWGKSHDCFVKAIYDGSLDYEAFDKCFEHNMKKQSLYGAAQQIKTHPKFKKKMKKYIKRMSDTTGITIERIVKETATIAFTSVDQFYRPDGTPKELFELDEGTRKALRSYKLMEKKFGDETILVPTFTFYDKHKALDMLMKQVGAYAAKELKITTEGAIQYYAPKKNPDN